MAKIQEIARQAALTKARELIGEDLVDEREVCALANAVAAAVQAVAYYQGVSAARRSVPPSDVLAKFDAQFRQAFEAGWSACKKCGVWAGADEPECADAYADYRRSAHWPRSRPLRPKGARRP